MDYNDVKRLVENNESQTVEFKEDHWPKAGSCQDAFGDVERPRRIGAVRGYS